MVCMKSIFFKTEVHDIGKVKYLPLDSRFLKATERFTQVEQSLLTSVGSEKWRSEKYDNIDPILLVYKLFSSRNLTILNDCDYILNLSVYEGWFPLDPNGLIDWVDGVLTPDYLRTRSGDLQSTGYYFDAVHKNF